MWILTSILERGPGCGSPQEPLPGGPPGKGSPSGGGEPGEPGLPGVGRGVGCGAAPMGTIGISGAGVAEGVVGWSSGTLWQAPTPSTDSASAVCTARRTARPCGVITRLQGHTPLRGLSRRGPYAGRGALPRGPYLVTWTLPQTPFWAHAS